ncbi:hypothetical protein BJF90_21165 [Pseudonocardia sp. CNS-004]|nr:hypothetical protein BJF90_21165 [Pseudonocardia sp. CNS-004]
MGHQGTADQAALDRVARKLKVREPVEEPAERDPQLGPCEVLALAHVRSGTEGDVPVARAAAVERLRIAELPRIAVRRGEVEQHPATLGKLLVADLHGAAQRPSEQLQRGGEPQALLDHPGQAAPVGAQLVPQAGQGQDVPDQPAERRSGGVVAAHDVGEQQTGRPGLVDHLALHGPARHLGEQVLAGTLPAIGQPALRGLVELGVPRGELGGAHRGVERGGDPPRPDGFLLVEPDHPPDHDRGQRFGQLVDEVGSARGGEIVDQQVDDRGDHRLERLHRARRQRSVEDTAPLRVLRIVELQRRDGRAQRAGGDLHPVRGGEGRRVGQRAADVLVAGEVAEPAVAVAVDDRAGLAHGGVGAADLAGGEGAVEVVEARSVLVTGDSFVCTDGSIQRRSRRADGSIHVARRCPRRARRAGWSTG